MKSSKLIFVLSRAIIVALLFRTSNSSNSPSVIIIGAGSAGIATATKLLKNNVSNFIILEAENRIGGRVNSVEFGDAIVDLGAEWCHGEKNNVVFEMVKNLDVLRLRDFSDLILAYYSNRARINPVLNNKLFGIIDSIYFPSGNKKQDEGISLGQYCLKEYNNKVSQLNLTDPLELHFTNDYKDFFERYTLSSEGSFSWDDPSAESDYRDCEGRLDWNWNGRGYKTALDVLMQKFPNTSQPLPIDDKILLNKEVEKIYWDNRNDTVSVLCKDNTLYNADMVVFTPSLGVLKDRHEKLFVPTLPEYKKIAIRNLGIGAVMKVMLLFEKSWWPQGSDFNGFMFIWASEDKNGKLEKFNINGKPWILDLMALLPVEKNPNVLSAWFVGSSVPNIEILNSKNLLDGLNFALDQFLSHEYNVTKPISFIRSQWYTNPHFRGTYSYQTIASRQTKSNAVIAQPLLNKNGKETVLFAGEATHPIRYSTVHGAIETGFREADSIIKKLNYIRRK
ncbi:spermine oxidase-like [Onthophagus taurus]|uniref:spermine oxidase-like n=1 Tax=Onthophagus taurus TaxID=166361 RepID=UPI000C20764A|nr:spermine oxidase-like [Onthophagus taurus]